MKNFRITPLSVIWSLAFPINFLVGELICGSQSYYPQLDYQTQISSVCVRFIHNWCEGPVETLHIPAEQPGLNCSRHLLKPSFTPAATPSAGIKSYKPETNTDEI